MSQELIKINPADFGMEETKAADIAAQFKPMLDRMVELETEYNAVIQLPVNKSTCAIAKALRLKYVKVRTGTADIHKSQKDFYLKAGRYIDGWKNAQIFASSGIEEKLEGIEKHYENQEKERVAKLQDERAGQLMAYEVDTTHLNLGIMSDDVWSNFLAGTKMNYETRKEAERKAEEERLAKIEAERIEQERVRAENERLKKEADEREAKMKAEREEAERLRKEAEERVRKEHEAMAAKAKKEMEEAAAEAKRIQDAKDAELAKEREEKARVEKELADKKAQEERKANEDRIAAEKVAKEKADAEQAELAKGDKEKMEDLKADIFMLIGKYTFKSEKYQGNYKVIQAKLKDIIDQNS